MFHRPKPSMPATEPALDTLEIFLMEADLANSPTEVRPLSPDDILTLNVQDLIDRVEDELDRGRYRHAIRAAEELLVALTMLREKYQS